MPTGSGPKNSTFLPSCSASAETSFQTPTIWSLALAAFGWPAALTRRRRKPRTRAVAVTANAPMRRRTRTSLVIGFSLKMDDSILQSLVILRRDESVHPLRHFADANAGYFFQRLRVNRRYRSEG